jgi:hypothetical protein
MDNFCILNKDLYNEVKEIMSHNFSDYYAEEYDPRFNYAKCNKAVDRIHEGDFLIEETNDFSEMCAIVRVLG